MTDELKVDGITISPGFAYERAPDQEHFIKRSNTKIFSEMSLSQKISRNGILVIQVFILIFLLEIKCINVHLGEILQEIFLGGKKPCYLLGEGYVKSFKELNE